jgi:hypothetical protein
VQWLKLVRVTVCSYFDAQRVFLRIVPEMRICAFAHLRICAFAHLRICAFAHLPEKLTGFATRIFLALDTNPGI